MGVPSTVVHCLVIHCLGVGRRCRRDWIQGSEEEGGSWEVGVAEVVWLREWKTSAAMTQLLLMLLLLMVAKGVGVVLVSAVAVVEVVPESSVGLGPRVCEEDSLALASMIEEVVAMEEG